MKRVLVYGSLEFGRVIKDLVIQCGREFAGFIDDYHLGDEVVGNFAVASEQCTPSSHEIAVAVGYKNLRARWEVFQRVKALGYCSPSLIHPRAYVRDPKNVGEGAFIMAGAVIDVEAHLGPLVVAWPGVVVNHDSRIGANTFLSPNCTVCGCVTIGSHCFIGAGSTIVDHVEVPPECFVKAGSLRTGKD